MAGAENCSGGGLLVEITAHAVRTTTLLTDFNVNSMKKLVLSND